MAESKRKSGRAQLPPADPPVSGAPGAPPGWQKLLESVRSDEWVVRQGGGPDAIERQHKKGRLTARERVVKLCDPDSGFFELSLFAAWKMYEEWGGAPSAGVSSPAAIMRVARL